MKSKPVKTLTLEPLEAPANATAGEVPADGTAELFAWPTPPLASYPGPSCPTEPEPCEVEGLNGRKMSGRLARFDATQGLLHLLTPTARAPLPLRFSQFRRITLSQPLAPTEADEIVDGDDPLSHRPALSFRVELEGAPPLEGLTVGHLQDDSGLYLFEPIDDTGLLSRSFLPRSAYVGVEIGERLGEVLVAHQAASRDAIEQTAREQEELRSQKLGDMLLVRQIVTPEQLEAAIVRQAKLPMVRIGEALLALGFIDQAQLDDALVQQRDDRSVPLGELLVRKGLVSRRDLRAALARKMGYPLVDVQQFPAEANALGRVPYAVAVRLAALPLMIRNGRIVVAMDDPSRMNAIDELEFVAQSKVVPVLAESSNLGAAIDKVYDRIGAGPSMSWESAQPVPAAPDDDAPDASMLLATLEQQHRSEQSTRAEAERPIEQSDNSLVKLINTMILEAMAQRVSDIHIECLPGRDKVRIRFRKDGILRPYLELPHTYRAALIGRLKIMCDLDISERRKPQDGKIDFSRFHAGTRLELRVATIPTHSGMEDAVLRLLASARALPIDALDLSADNLARLQEAAQRPYGMVLCVGPTGSGKTTTLHSVLGMLNQPDRKIWTAEDPIEITQPGLRQVQVNPKIDWTFAKALRAFLRADPDVIMVGEIRDKETAQVAIEASLTGHLLLSTLHTNSAPETVTRLLDMGMDPFNFADSLLAVLAQRLVRRLCPECRTARPATATEVDELLADYMHSFTGTEAPPSADQVRADWLARYARNGQLMHFDAPGCLACGGSGLLGRTGLHELLTMSRAQRHLVQTGARSDEIQRQAIAEGMRTLRQDGIDKVLAGLTSIAEVRASTHSDNL